MWKRRALALGGSLALVAACGTAVPPGGTATLPPTTASPTAPQQTAGTEPPGQVTATPARTVEAPTAAISIDGDPAEWSAVEGLDLTLEGIEGVEVPVESKQATVKVAHDDRFVFVLFEVQDDYDWSGEDPHLSGSPAVMWAVQAQAGPHMGPEDEEGKGPSLGMVDIWHWELECAARVQSGGEVSDPGDGDPGNDAACNFDDEWATSPEDREDDNGAGAENSFLGTWSHTNPTAGTAGSWVFEIRRPLQTGDEQDAQFAAGSTALLALAYWDADQTAAGWEDDGHSQSSNEGWIEVTFK